MKTPREILSQLQKLSTTCETPEDGILKALKIIGDSQDDAYNQGIKDLANKLVEGHSLADAESIITKTVAAMPNIRS
jgi:hypothetical protein